MLTTILIAALFVEGIRIIRHEGLKLVTTAYHLFRALLLAKRQGLKCIRFGAKTKWYFTLNALIREFAGYLRLTWKRHAFIAVSLIVAVVFLT